MPAPNHIGNYRTDQLRKNFRLYKGNGSNGK